MILTISILFIEFIPLVILIVFLQRKSFFKELYLNLYNKKLYSNFVRKATEREMKALFLGSIKRHRIVDTNKFYSLKSSVESYHIFLEKSPVMDMILNIKEEKM